MHIAQLFSSACVGISSIVALSVFIYTRKVNRRRATLDMVLKTFVDDDGKKRYAAFKELLKKDKDCSNDFSLIVFAEPSLDISGDRGVINNQLNEYELISLGIGRKVFDESLYKLWFQGQFIKDYESVSELIKKIQEKRPSVYCDFKYLYEKWRKEPHPENRPSRLKLIWWAITRNEAKLAAYSELSY